MSSFSFDNAAPNLTATAVGITLVLGLGWFHATSSSNISKSPTFTTTFGWLQKGINRLLTRKHGVKTPIQYGSTTSMVVHTEQQGVIRRRTGLAAARARANLSRHNADQAIADREFSTMKEGMIEMKTSIRQLQEDNAEHRRDITINRAMLSIHHEKHVQSDVLHDASNKRHNATEGEVKVLQKDMKGLTEEKELLTLSVVVITIIVVALVVINTTSIF